MGRRVSGQGGSTFSERVVVLFATRMVTSVIGIVNSVLIARLLGPAAKGEYTLLLLPPATLMVLVQLGLPSALGFYAARGQTLGIIRKTLILAALLSPAALVAVAFLPFLRETFLHDLNAVEIVVALSALPLLLVATMANAIVIARQAINWYAAVNIGQYLLAMVLLIALVGALGLGVAGAIAAYMVYSAFTALGLLVGAVRSSSRVPDPKPVSYRQLFHFGLPLYPGSLSEFFNLNVDIYLLSLLLADAAAPLGYYSLAVGLASMVFYIPSAVSNVFFPFVAAASREEADARLPIVSRVTLLVTGASAIALLPASAVLIRVLLPAFLPSLGALCILLPASVALSVSNVMGSYLSGLGRTATVSMITLTAFAVNVVVNVALIPHFSFLGASAASLASYSASAIIMTLVAARLTGHPFGAFWALRRSDLDYTVQALLALVHRLRLRFDSLGRA